MKANRKPATVFYTSQDLAHHLKVSTVTIRNRLREGVYKPDGVTSTGQALFRLKTIQRYAKAR